MAEIEAQLRAFYDVEMAARARRPLGEERRRRVEAFAALLRAEGARSVLEVGCGAGRDGAVLASAVQRYVGVDLSPAAVRTCRDLGLEAHEARATALPLDADAVDAAWTMSTLMHLPGDGMTRAIDELARVVRSGGHVEIGVWGSTETREWTAPDGRYFLLRSDADLQAELDRLGDVVATASWDWHDEHRHYQWSRVRLR